jgi:tetratricopeptide (TPR) repeat protein
MQRPSLKKVLTIGLIVSLSIRVAVAADPVRQADSLFRSGQHTQAAGLFEMAIAQGQSITPAMLLKLAYVSEQQGDIARLLYYLQSYLDRQPDSAVLRRMNEIARINGLSGYETDDLNYFLLFYKQFGLYVLALLLLPAVYVCVVMVQKKLHNEPIPGGRKWVTLLYLTALLIFVNLPEGYKSGIVSQDQVLLRQQPSAAAPVAAVIGRGHKVNILGHQDIYLRVLWNNQLYYLRQDQVWLL